MLGKYKSDTRLYTNPPRPRFGHDPIGQTSAPWADITFTAKSDLVPVR